MRADPHRGAIRQKSLSSTSHLAPSPAVGRRAKGGGTHMDSLPPFLWGWRGEEGPSGARWQRAGTRCCTAWQTRHSHGRSCRSHPGHQGSVWGLLGVTQPQNELLLGEHRL